MIDLQQFFAAKAAQMDPMKQAMEMDPAFVMAQLDSMMKQGGGMGMGMPPVTDPNMQNLPFNPTTGIAGPGIPQGAMQGGFDSIVNPLVAGDQPGMDPVQLNMERMMALQGMLPEPGQERNLPMVAPAGGHNLGQYQPISTAQGGQRTQLPPSLARILAGGA